MAEEFEGDLAGAVFWGADLSGAVFRDVDLSGAQVSHARMVDVAIDAAIERLVVNGVDVTAFVNERDPWYPLRTMLSPSDPDAMRATWAALEQEWATTLATAQALPKPQWHASVSGEWSFAQTLRHVVFAIDKWCTGPVLGDAFHPVGLPNSGSVDFPWPDIDPALQPDVAETVAVWQERMASVRGYLAGAAPDDLACSVEVLENGPHTVRDCIAVVFEETFWHLRYARRDLTALAGTA